MKQSHMINTRTIQAEFDAFEGIVQGELVQAFYFFKAGTSVYEVCQWIERTVNKTKTKSSLFNRQQPIEDSNEQEDETK